MNKIHSIPVDLNTINECENLILDMSDLNFDVEIDNIKRSAFIFLRNICLSVPYTFDNCSYKDKEEYLLLYMRGDININIKELSETWLHILSILSNTRIDNTDSILNDSEVIEFITNNNDYVNEIYRFSISIPMFSVFYYMEKSNSSGYIDNNISNCEFDEINLINFINIVDDKFIYLINNNATIEPAYYSNIVKSNSYFVNMILNKLPYLNILNMFFSNDDTQDSFIDQLNTFYC